MNPILPALMLVSVLIPTRTWYPPDQPLLIHIKPDAPITLALTDFDGQNIDPVKPADVPAEQTLDIKQLFPLKNPGAYLLYALPRGALLKDFVGTPLVIEVRADNRAGAPPGPMIVKVHPMAYGLLATDKGLMTITFYYDVAPDTVANFMSLAQGGFYDNLAFFKITRDFIIQTGDPRNDGTGGPGYHIEQEFNDRPHEEGVLSMSRQIDPNEPGAMPRAQFANSAGSQFFICLNYDNTRQLDRRYTAFGRVVDGMGTVRAIAASPTTGPSPATTRPTNLPKITKLEIRPVTATDNPYAKLAELATTRPLEGAPPR